MKEISPSTGMVVVVVLVLVVVELVEVVVVLGGGLVSWAVPGISCIEVTTGGTQTKPLKATPRRKASRLVRPDESDTGA
jgi:hypothetical protein